MKKILYKKYSRGFYTSGSQAWKSKREKELFLQSQRGELKNLVNGFEPNPNRWYHMRVRFYLKQSRLGSDIDNLLKEFNDALFGTNRDQKLFSISAIKIPSSSECVRFWIYELP